MSLKCLIKPVYQDGETLVILCCNCDIPLKDGGAEAYCVRCGDKVPFPVESNGTTWGVEYPLGNTINLNQWLSAWLGKDVTAEVEW